MPLIVLSWSFFNPAWAAELSPQEKASFGIAQSQFNLAKYDEAIKILEDLHEKYPEDKEITLILAQAFGFSLKLDEARLLMDGLIKDFPRDQAIKKTYANILEANQHFTQAREIYTDLLKQDPDNQELLMKIADVSSWMGDYQSAINYYTALREKDKDDLELKRKLADLYLWSQDYQEAIKLYKETGVKPETDRKRFKNLGDAYLKLRQYQQALQIYDQLRKLFPSDIQIRADIANTLYAAGKIKEAEEEFKQIIKENPTDIKAILKAAEIMALRQHYQEAIKLCNNALSLDPDNSLARLWLARITSWDKRYSKALALYDEIISKDPNWIIPRREKARVLGWMREYKKSIKEYLNIFEKVKEDQVARTEMEAKNAFFRRFYARAIKQYNNWLTYEPEHLEALFDLGQVYGRQMQWDNTQDIQNRILRMLPEHFRAEQAMDKIELYSKHMLATGGFEFREADSGTRQADVRYYRFFENLQTPLNKHSYFKLGLDSFFYFFPIEPNTVTRQKLWAVFEYYLKPLFWLRSGYSFNLYSDKVDDSHNFFEELYWQPTGPLRIDLSHRRQDVIDNVFTLTRKLQRDDYKLRLLLTPNRRLDLGADYTYSRFSDGNIKQAHGFDIKAQILYEPRNLSILYRFEEYRYKQPKDYYFSPSSFHYNGIGIEWQHFLNKEELFWGANDTYYRLRYSINFDVQDQVAHIFYADFFKDWNDKLATHLEWSKTVYEHEKIYSEDKFLFYLKYYF